MIRISHQRASNRDRGAFISSAFLAALSVYTQLAAEPVDRPEALIETTAREVLEAFNVRRQELSQNPVALAEIIERLNRHAATAISVGAPG